jgi:hypothetical protein
VEEEKVKIIRIERLIDSGGFSSQENWKTIEHHITQAIKAIQWPPDSGSFTLYDQPGKARGEGSGVKPIKDACMLRLRSFGWDLEARVPIAALKQPGKVDAAFRVGNRLFCVEWETGNISSSHRAINKMALGILKGVLIGGALVVPTRTMYRYLTDRVGNFAELEPYFPLWRTLTVEEGLLVVIAIEHDAVSRSVPRIPKGTNGRALH